MRWLKKFLPIVLFALAVQIFAPIGACWAASIAASDPLAGAVICHGNAAPGAGQTDQAGHRAHDGCCSVCSVVHAGAPVDPPPSAVSGTGTAGRIVKWQDNAGALIVAADRTMKVDQYLATTGPPKR